MLDVRTVGLAPDLIPYTDAWALQREVHAAVASGDRPDTRSSSSSTSRSSPPAPAPPGTSVRPTAPPWSTSTAVARSRGMVRASSSGTRSCDCTSPSTSSRTCGGSEGILIHVLAGLGVEGYRVEGRSGVWVRRLLSEDKIAAIGIRVQRGVTMHGFALNCDNSLLPFSQIIPCGIADAGVTTVSEVLGRDVRPADVVDAVSAAFQASFAALSPVVAA